MRRTIPKLLVLGFALALPAAADSVIVESSRDATMIEEPDGLLANGAGTSLFSGRTGQMQNGIRRVLLYFDVAAALPEGALIESVSLSVFSASANVELRKYRLHRLLADWGEGASFSSGGQGAPAEPGDATWIHRSFDDTFWTSAGGQFVGTASATRVVGDVGFYIWESSPGLMRDVRFWSRHPPRNFGWVLIGDETTRQTAKTFSSRESADPSVRPTLTIHYRTRGFPAQRPLQKANAR